MQAMKTKVLPTLSVSWCWPLHRHKHQQPRQRLLARKGAKRHSSPAMLWVWCPHRATQSRRSTAAAAATLVAGRAHAREGSPEGNSGPRHVTRASQHPTPAPTTSILDTSSTRMIKDLTLRGSRLVHKGHKIGCDTAQCLRGHDQPLPYLPLGCCSLLSFQPV